MNEFELKLKELINTINEIQKIYGIYLTDLQNSEFDAVKDIINKNFGVV